MTDADIVELGFDILENAEVVQEFEKTVWVAIDKDAWEAFCKSWEAA